MAGSEVRQLFVKIGQEPTGDIFSNQTEIRMPALESPHNFTAVILRSIVHHPNLIGFRNHPLKTTGQIGAVVPVGDQHGDHPGS
jgi:hypothetical protein